MNNFITIAEYDDHSVTAVWIYADTVEMYAKNMGRISPEVTVKVLDINNREWTVYKAGKIVECNMGVVV